MRLRENAMWRYFAREKSRNNGVKQRQQQKRQ